MGIISLENQYKKGEEADAIFGKSLEDMTKAQNDVIGDLIAANEGSI